MGGKPFRSISKAALNVVIFSALAGCVTMSRDITPPRLPLAVGDKYVAMGSSFAAGPGVTYSADQPTNRCERSNDNYARQLARALSLSLFDVSCSGATTKHVLGPWNELHPQVDALDADTRLVTVTVGGNDVSLVRNLIAFGCGSASNAGSPRDARCPTVNIPTEQEWQIMEAGLEQIASTAKKRAPKARLAFVQYVKLVPDSGGCAALGFSADEVNIARQIASRLSVVTAAVAKRSGALLIDADADGRAHDPCSKEPWATGFPAPNEKGFVPFHPNLAGMNAIARALQNELSR